MREMSVGLGVCMEGECCVGEMSVGLVPVWKVSVVCGRRVWGWCLYGR